MSQCRNRAARGRPWEARICIHTIARSPSNHAGHAHATTHASMSKQHARPFHCTAQRSPAVGGQHGKGRDSSARSRWCASTLASGDVATTERDTICVSARTKCVVHACHAVGRTAPSCCGAVAKPWRATYATVDLRCMSCGSTNVKTTYTRKTHTYTSADRATPTHLITGHVRQRNMIGKAHKACDHPRQLCDANGVANAGQQQRCSHRHS